MSTQIDNIYLETNTSTIEDIETNVSIIEKIDRLTNVFSIFFEIWNNNFASIEDDSSYDESYESFLKTL